MSTFGKVVMEQYTAAMGDSEQAEPIREFEQILEEDTTIMLENIRLYGLKLLARDMSYGEFTKKYAVINRLPWVYKRYSESILKEEVNVEGSQSSAAPSPELTATIKSFLDSEFADMGSLKRMLA